MTNAMIILFEQVKLMEDGKIGTTGRTFTFEDGEGNVKELPEPEPIHTFTKWKSLGYSVKRGEKAIAKFCIWKYSSRKSENDEGEEVENSRMFMKMSCFFSFSQMEKIKR